VGADEGWFRQQPVVPESHCHSGAAEGFASGEEYSENLNNPFWSTIDNGLMN
jgi:hypothetical protein